MTSAERHRTATGAARRRGETQRADGDRRVGQIIKARRALAPRVARVWPNGREVARAGARYMHLEASQVLEKPLGKLPRRTLQSPKPRKKGVVGSERPRSSSRKSFVRELKRAARARLDKRSPAN